MASVPRLPFINFYKLLTEQPRQIFNRSATLTARKFDAVPDGSFGEMIKGFTVEFKRYPVATVSHIQAYGVGLLVDRTIAVIIVIETMTLYTSERSNIVNVRFCALFRDGTIPGDGKSVARLPARDDFA